MRFLRSRKRLLVFPVLAFFLVASGVATVALAACGPFSDVASGICPFVLSMYFLGITAGTTSTTYSPGTAVTRGQMAVFMGALYNQVKRTENPSRVGRQQYGSPFGTNPFNAYSSPNTSNPNAFATNGAGLAFVSNYSNNIIDAFYGSYNHGLYTSYSGGGLVTGYGIACDNVDIYAPDNGGTSVQRIQLNNGAVISAWATTSGGNYDVANAGQFVGVTTSVGMAIIAKSNAVVTTVNMGDTTGYGVIFDGTNFWMVDNFGGVGLWDEVNMSGSLINNGALDGMPTGHIAFDGQNIWVPTAANLVDVIATKGAQGNTVVDRLGLVWSNSTSFGPGITFTGENVVVAENGDYGCGNPTTILVAYNAATHAYVDSVIGACSDGTTAGLGFDGRNIYQLGNLSNIFRIF